MFLAGLLLLLLNSRFTTCWMSQKAGMYTINTNLMKEHKTVITPEKSIKHEIAQSLVAEKETLLSAVAWKGFRERGRGYLFFHRAIDVEHIAGNDFGVKASPSPTEERLQYIEKGGEMYNFVRASEAAAGQTKEWTKFYELVDTYNPRNEFLVVVGMNQDDRATEHWFAREPNIPPYKAFLIVRKRP